MIKNDRYRLVRAEDVVKRLIPAGGVPRIVLMVGLPASGKSTFSEGLMKAGFTLLSLDRIREELYGNAAEQGDWRKTRRRFDELFDEALDARRNIVVDNTNYNRSQRGRIIAKAKKAGVVDAHIVMLDVPLDECLRRNRSRSRVVAEEVIRGMHKELSTTGYPADDEAVLTVLKPTDDRGLFQGKGFAASGARVRRRR